ncbi:hypothetical protein AB0H73_07785 [Streptomyces olivoreticuli]
MEVVRITAESGDGRSEGIDLGVDDSGTPTIKLTRANGAISVHPGEDLFECLKSVRHALESDGLLACCQGSRPTVFSSGMGRQMSNGRLAYPLRRVPPLTDADLIDIFAPAHLSEVGTVEEQRQAVMEFFGFTKK